MIEHASDRTYSKLVLGDPDHPFAEIEPLNIDDIHSYQEVPLKTTQLGQFSAIFQHVPGISSNLLTASSQTYIMRFSPEVIKGLQDGSLSMMQAKEIEGGLRAIAVKGNKIKENAVLMSASHLRLTAAVAVVWQALAIVTAQHYLSEINSELKQISQSISRIQAHIEAEDKAVVKSSLQHILSMKSLLQEFNLSETDIIASLSSLDAVDRDCRKVLQKYMDLKSKIFQEMRAEDFSNFLGAKFEEAVQKGLKYLDYSWIALNAIFVLAIASSMRCALPSKREVALRRLEDCDRELENWHRAQEAFTEVFKGKIQTSTNSFLPVDDISSLLGMGKPLKSTRKAILNEATEKQKEALRSYYKLRISTKQQIKQVTNQINGEDLYTALLIEVDTQHKVKQVLQYAHD